MYVLLGEEIKTRYLGLDRLATNVFSSDNRLDIILLCFYFLGHKMQALSKTDNL